MKLYVVGPVTGFDDLNRAAFEKARTVLIADGYQVLLPHDFVAANATWQQAIRRSLETLAKADGLACLDGWSASHGATLEIEIAQRLGMPVMGVESWIDPSLSLRAIEEAHEAKFCPRCKRTIPRNLFERSEVAFDGKKPYCIDCIEDTRQGKRAAHETA